MVCDYVTSPLGRQASSISPRHELSELRQTGAAEIVSGVGQVNRRDSRRDGTFGTVAELEDAAGMYPADWPDAQYGPISRAWYARNGCAGSNPAGPTLLYGG